MIKLVAQPVLRTDVAPFGQSLRMPLPMAFRMALRMAICLFFGLVFLNCALDLQAEEVRVDAKVSRSEIQIVDPFELEIRVVAPEGTQVSLPAAAESLGPFQILSTDEKFDVPVSDESGNNRLWIRSLSLETLQTGQLEIPIIEVVIKQVGQPEEIVRTKPIAINVGSVVEPTADLTQFKGVADVHDLEVPAPQTYRWVWLASGVTILLVGLAGAGLFLITRPKPSDSAKVWALKKLNTVRELPMAETILRQFIEERFEFAATSLPAERLVGELQSQDVKASTLQDVEELLQKSERAKFGGLDLPETEKSRLLSLANQLVDQLDQTGGQS